MVVLQPHQHNNNNSNSSSSIMVEVVVVEVITEIVEGGVEEGTMLVAVVQIRFLLLACEVSLIIKINSEVNKQEMDRLYVYLDMILVS